MEMNEKEAAAVTADTHWLDMQAAVLAVCTGLIFREETESSEVTGDRNRMIFGSFQQAFLSDQIHVRRTGAG